MASSIQMVVCEDIYYDFFDFRLDVEKQRLLKNGQPVQLTHKAFQILLLLVQNSGQTTKKEDIFDRLWADSFVEDANLTQHIYVLRKALGQTPDGQSFIETVPKQGYRFTLLPGQVSVTKKNLEKTPETETAASFDFSGGQAISSIRPDDPVFQHSGLSDLVESNGLGVKQSDIDEFLPTPAPPVAVARRRVSRPRLVALILLLVFGVSAATAIYYFRRETPPATTAAAIKSIAVLPFKPIGEEVDKEKLGLGMADAVITRLSKLQQITVRPTSAVFRYTDQPAASASAAGRDLGVDAVLEGTVQCDGERVRVSVQLVRVADGQPLWAESFQEKISDIFAVQDSISAKVAAALSPNLTPQQESLLARRVTSNAEAFQSYQLGIYFLNKRTEGDLFRAVEYFRQATAHDPDYAQAYAGLADSYSMLAYYQFADVDEMKEKAKVTAEKALALNDSLAEAYVALAMAYVVKRENLPKAQELLERAVTLAPYNASARHRYGWILLTNGKLDEGAREMRLAREYDPLSPATNRAYCSVLVMQRNFPDAIRQCETTLEIYLKTPNSRRALARAYFYNGRYSEAFEQLEIQIKSGTEKEVITARGESAYYYAKLGRTAEAEKLYARLKQQFEKDPERASELALIAFALGKKDEALIYFKEMLKFPDIFPDSHILFAYDPHWDEMKADARFAPLFPK